MAQAARLHLRLQKELKLLLSDPPPGISLPLLSDGDSTSVSSLSIIDARIRGPEGTVYSGGLFALKIQIPERYPFQPPVVTFNTPIYHPNIDNGGRICLDILNLPPKGAWQPSLNISTVLTSILLLLSEPNPDDGLMADISKEYKYNRQAFDMKARSWTEKYAGACKNADSGSQRKSNMLLQPMQPQIAIDGEGIRSENTLSENESRKKLRLTGEKLSLKPMPVMGNTNDQENVAPTRRLSLSRAQVSLSSAGSASSNNGIYSCKKEVKNENVSNGNSRQEERSKNTMEMVIVLDSEESDEEENISRSRLPLRKRQ